jgi:aminopeptidase-like protein
MRSTDQHTRNPDDVCHTSLWQPICESVTGEVLRESMMKLKDIIWIIISVE